MTQDDTLCVNQTNITVAKYHLYYLNYAYFSSWGGGGKKPEVTGIATQSLSDGNKGGKGVVRNCMDKAWRVATEAKPTAG